MAAVTYAEGDWFAVPLRNGGFVLGLVARASPSGVLLGYFFGPSRTSPPSLGDAVGLKATDAILVGMFGHLGLTTGPWANLGHTDRWERDNWPTPLFSRYEELTGRSFLVYYDDFDPGKRSREEQVAPAVAVTQPEDGLMGPGFVEIRLTQILDSAPTPRDIRRH